MVIRSTRSVLVGSAFAALGLLACTATTETPTGAKNGSSSSSSSSSSSGGSETTSSSSSSSSSSSGGTAGDAAACGGKSDFVACMDCCTKDKPDVFQKADEAFQQCLCGGSGVCKTECATDACAADPKSAQESPSCQECIKQKGEPCFEAGEAACDDDCKAASACAEAAKCEEKE